MGSSAFAQLQGAGGGEDERKRGVVRKSVEVDSSNLSRNAVTGLFLNMSNHNGSWKVVAGIPTGLLVNSEVHDNWGSLQNS